MSELADAPTTEPTDGEESPAPKSYSQIAEEVFGDQYVGEVTDAAPEKEDEPAPEAEDTPVEAEEVDEPEAEDTPVEAEGDDEPQETSFTLNELAEANEMTIEQLMESFAVPIKIDGNTSQVKLAELVKNVQIDGAAESRLESAKATAQRIVEEAELRQHETNAQFNVAATFLNQIEASLEAQLNQIDLEDLKANDPGMYASTVLEINQARDGIQRMKQDAIAQYEQATLQGRERTAQEHVQLLRSENERLVEAIPDWQDQEIRTKEQSELWSWLSGQGFNETELGTVADHRLIKMARDAKRYQDIKKNGAVAANRVKKVPKLMKPGTSVPKEQRAQSELATLLKRAQTSGKQEDAEAYIRAKRQQR